MNGGKLGPFLKVVIVPTMRLGALGEADRQLSSPQSMIPPTCLDQPVLISVSAGKHCRTVGVCKGVLSPDACDTLDALAVIVVL